MFFVGREREIFRDVFNLLEKNDLNTFTEEAKAITDKYTNLDDKMFCTELLGVVRNHMNNTRLK